MHVRTLDQRSPGQHAGSSCWFALRLQYLALFLRVLTFWRKNTNSDCHSLRSLQGRWKMSQDHVGYVDSKSRGNRPFDR